MKDLYIFGDSILKGVVFSSKGPKRYSLYGSTLCERLLAKGVVARNLARMGSTITDGAKTIDSFLTSHAGVKKSSGKVLLGFGGNDSMYRWREIAEAPELEHRQVTDIDTFYRTYSSIAERLKAAGFEVALSTIVPIDPDRYLSHVSRDLGIERIKKWPGLVSGLESMHDAYNEAIVALAERHSAELIDLRGLFTANCKGQEDLLCADGIHPNRTGHLRIEDALADHYS